METPTEEICEGGEGLGPVREGYLNMKKKLQTQSFSVRVMRSAFLFNTEVYGQQISKEVPCVAK
jgi:hypothetical protein